MNKDETKQILTVIASLYPSFNKNLDAEQVRATVAAWHWALEEHSYGEISEALKAYVKINGSAFAPSCAELIAYTRKPQELEELGALEAWGLVSKAVSRSAYYYEEEFAKLPETVQKAVGSADQLHAWAMGDADTLETVIASNFQKAYRAEQERERQRALLPQDMRTKALIEKTLLQLETGQK